MPLAQPGEITVTPLPRYERMRDDYAQLVREQLICGAQTHVGQVEPGMALAVARRLARWQPVLLALSASSPFWLGEDTGYASWRSQVWRRWPTTGPLPALQSLDELDELSAALVATGVVSDAGMLYWDLRLNQRTGTLEFRLGDACPSVEMTVVLAALARALVTAARDGLLAGHAEAPVPVPVVEAGRWRASRSGLREELVDPMSGRPLPAAAVLDRLLEHTGPALRATGDLDAVSSAFSAALGGGGSAGRQQACAAGAGLTGVVDALVAETAGATRWAS